jgi:hypothetical protein
VNGIIRKLLLSVLSFALIVSLFGTVTFAWFSIAKTNAIHNITVNISSGDEFQISLDGVNFFKEISSEMIMESIGDQVELVDVTSDDGINFYRGGPNGTAQVQKNTDYISIVLWFRTIRPQRTVYLVDNVSDITSFEKSGEGTYAVSKGINWTSDATFRNGENENDMVYAGDRHAFYAADALRIGFAEEKVTNNPHDTRSENELKRTIFDLSGNQARGYGMTFGAFDYYNVKRADDLIPPTKVPDTVYDLTEFYQYNPYDPLDDNSDILQMIQTGNQDVNGFEYYLGQTVMNIWLEGWDSDCFDAIFTDSVKIRLKFWAGYSYSQDQSSKY